MELHCPQCQHVLDQDNGHARCRSCGEFIEMKALCPDCHQPLQVLKARADRSNLLHHRLLTPATVDGSLDKELSFQ